MSAEVREHLEAAWCALEAARQALLREADGEAAAAELLELRDGVDAVKRMLTVQL